MHFQTESEQRRQGWCMELCLVATMVLAASCDRGASTRADQRGATVGPFKVADVHVRTGEARLMFQYRTQTASGDCKAQVGEMPNVWDQLVKAGLTDSHVEHVILFPEDPSGQSVGFEFTKTASGWSAEAPCSVTIPGK